MTVEEAKRLLSQCRRRELPIDYAPNIPGLHVEWESFERTERGMCTHWAIGDFDVPNAKYGDIVILSTSHLLQDFYFTGEEAASLRTCGEFCKADEDDKLEMYQMVGHAERMKEHWDDYLAEDDSRYENFDND